MHYRGVQSVEMAYRRRPADRCNDFIVITTADVKGVAADHRITCSPPVTKKINMHPVRHLWPYLASSMLQKKNLTSSNTCADPARVFSRKN